MPTLAELRTRHGTLEEFERAVWAAHAQLFVTTDEAVAGIAKYRAEWIAAGGTVPQPYGPHIDALSLAILFHFHYERLAPQYGYETREGTRKFDPNSPNGKLMVATCGAVLDALSSLPSPDPEAKESHDAGS
jgi:hypothetical protein